MEGREPQVARVLRLLAGVDDVVHLAVLLRGASANVAAAEGVRLESTDVALAQIQGRLTADDPLGDGPADASGVGDPYRLRRPETIDTGRFPEHRKPVSGEREQAVELAGQADAPQAGKKLARCRHRRLEVSGCKRHFGRRDGCLRVAEDVSGIYQQGLVPVGPDADGRADLPEVRRCILVTQYR